MTTTCYFCEREIDPASELVETVKPSDGLTSWYERLGVTEEMLKEHDGRQFCNEHCEASFWTGLALWALAVGNAWRGDK